MARHQASEAEYRLQAYEMVRRHVESLCRQYLTLQPGKVLEYTYKEEEYRAWVAAGHPAGPDPALYPLAAAGGPEMNLTLPEMLALIGQRAAECRQAGAQIAALERRLLVALDAAQTIEEVNGVLETMTSIMAQGAGRGKGQMANF